MSEDRTFTLGRKSWLFGESVIGLDTGLAATVTTGELIANGDFAEGTEGWDILNPTGGSEVGGTGFVRLNGGNEAAGGDGIEQTIFTLPNETYSFSTTLSELDGGNGNHTALIEIVDATGFVIESREVLVTNNSRVTETIEFTATGFDTTIRITNPTSTTSYQTDLRIENVEVIGATIERPEFAPEVTDNLQDGSGVNAHNIRAVELITLENGDLVMISSERSSDGIATYKIDNDPSSATYGQMIGTNTNGNGHADLGARIDFIQNEVGFYDIEGMASVTLENGRSFVFTADPVKDAIGIAEILPDGSLAHRGHIRDDHALDNVQQLSIVENGGNAYLLAMAGGSSNSLFSFAIGDAGALSQVQRVVDGSGAQENFLNGGGDTSASFVESHITAAGTSLVITGGDDDGIALWTVNADGTLNFENAREDNRAGAGEFDPQGNELGRDLIQPENTGLVDPNAAAFGEIGGQTYVFVGGNADNVEIFRIDPDASGDGTLDLTLVGQTPDIVHDISSMAFLETPEGAKLVVGGEQSELKFFGIEIDEAGVVALNPDFIMLDDQGDPGNELNDSEDIAVEGGILVSASDNDDGIAIIDTGVLTGPEQNEVIYTQTGAEVLDGGFGDDLFVVSAGTGAGDTLLGGALGSSDYDVLDLRDAGEVMVRYSSTANDDGGMSGEVYFADDFNPLNFAEIEAVLTSTQLISSEMVHGADGIASVNGSTYYFHGKGKDGFFEYGHERLQNDNKDSFALSGNDLSFLMAQAELGVVDRDDLADVSQSIGLRELDGFGNNADNPLWGNADQLFKRLSKADYEDGIGEVRDGPNPRDISNIIINQNKDNNPNLFGVNAGAQDKNLENDFRANEFTWAFGQYFDHGLDFLPKGGVNGDGTTAGVINAGNASFPLTLTRGAVAEGTGIDSAREHVNQTSPFADQNQAYGSNDLILEFLLERDENGQFTGRLLSGANTDVPTLGEAKANWQLGVDAGLAEAIDWSDPEAISNFRDGGDALLLDINPFIPLDMHLVAGDGRVNENAGLSVVHTIWHNNHNFWVDELLDIFHTEAHGEGCTCLEDGPGGPLGPIGTPPGGPLGPIIPEDVTAEDIFHMAKIINEAEYQRAAFDEFVELLVGSDVHAFEDYNPNINADITHEFAAAAYRLGHSMLNNTVTVANDDGSTRDVPLFDLFLNPIKFAELGADNLMEGMANSIQQEIDSKIVTTMRNNLLGRPLDLAAFNIARGRDVGLPTLNDMREMVGLSRYSNWDEFASKLRYSDDLEKFQAAYDSVDDIDLWVGGLAEEPSGSDAFGSKLAGNSVMGETFAQVFSVQMIAIQDGDRFYYKERLFETELLLNIQGQDFSQIVERTLGLDYLQASILQTVENRLDFRDVDQTILELEGTDGHDVIIGRAISETIRGKDGEDTIYLEAGDDVGYGGDGDDAIFGDAGDDTIIGESGDDRADGGTGNDKIYGGHGDDDLSGDEGDDFIDGGENDDEMQGGAGKDTMYGGDGDDMVAGGLGNDYVDGGSGNDRVNGNDGNDVIDGGSGDDDVFGGRGQDVMTGGEGKDTFWFLPESGDDRITDFNVSEDRVDLHRYVWEFGEDAVNLASIYANTVNTAEGAKMTLEDGSTILFEGVSKSALFSNSSHTFVFEDKVIAREGLILDKQTGIVVDAGTRNEVIEDELTGEVTIITPEDREDFTVSATDLIANGFGTETGPGVVTSFEDFESGSSGWSGGRIRSLSNGDDYLGGHGGYGSHAPHFAEAKSYTLAENTGSVTIEFDFLEIDSWDNERFFIEIDGNAIDLGTFTWKANEGATSFNVGGYQIEKSASQDLAPNAGNSSYHWSHNDSSHSYKITVNDVDGQLDLRFGAALSGGSWEESWGVNNLSISEGAQVMSLRYPEYITQVAKETFETANWSNPGTGATNDGNAYLGGHGSLSGNIETRKSFDLSGTADEVEVTFDLLEIDSWDGERFYVEVNGQAIDLGRFYVDGHYGDRGEGGSGTSGGVSWSVASEGLVTENFAGHGSYSDEVHAVTLTISNPTDVLNLGFGSSLGESASNESWGVDNLVISEITKSDIAAAEGTLTHIFEGESGGYDVRVNTYDENDGLAAVKVLLNGDEMHYQVLDQDLGYDDIGENLVTVTADNLFIKEGDEVDIVGISNGGEYVRIEDIEFVAINDPYETLFV